MAKAVGKPQLANSAIEAGRIEEYDADGSLMQIVGEQHDGTHVPVTVNGPVPPEPVPPTLSAGIGSVEGRWSGKFVGDALSPMDLSHVALHASRVEVFTPSNETQLATITGELGDVAVVLLEPGEWTFALVAVSKAGKWSEMSESVTVDVPDYPSPMDIQDELILLDEKYDGVITEASNLGNRLDQAEQELTAHEGRLGTAEQRVSDAFVQIDAADGKATAAAGAASAAQSKADTAAQAAADAAGIANGKGKVLVQSTAPGVADRNAMTLWIDTTGGANTPKRWTTGTTWVAVTDKAATDAAAAAAQAAQTAANAQAAAGSAQTTANNALTMAGTKGKVFYSTAEPSGTGTADGDLWRRVDASKNVIGEWYWSGSAWVSSQITTSAIANLDVGKLTVGTGVIADLVAQTIAASTAAFQTVDVKNLFVTTGTLTEAVINKLWADVVMSRKITTQMLAVGSFDNVIPGGGFTDRANWDGNSRLTIVEGESEFGGPVGRFAGKGSTSSCYVNLPTDSQPCEAGNSYRVRGQVRSSVNTAAGAVRIMARFTYANGSYTWPTVSAPALVAGQWTSIDGVVTAPANTVGIRFALNVQAAFPDGANADFANVSATRMSNGELVVDGSVKAKQIDTEDLAANTGFIADLTARIVKSDMFVGKEFQGGTFTGSVFQTSGIANVGMKLDNDGLRAYGPEGGEPAVEIRPDGGTAVQISNPATGEVLGGIDSEGGLSGTGLSVSGEARVDGVLVTGGDPIVDGFLGGDEPGRYGPIHNGRALFGRNFQDSFNLHPSTEDNTSWMEAIPFGVISNGWIQSTAGWGWNGLGGQPHYRIVMGVTATLVHGRGYMLTWKAPPFEQTTTNGALTGSANIGGSFVRYSAPGGGVSANGSGNVLPGTLQYIPGGGTSFAPGGTTYIRCPEDVPAGKIMFGIEVYCYANRSMVSASNVNANRWEITIADNGMRRALNDSVPASSSQQGTEPVPPPLPPQPDPVREYVDTINATWWQAYTGDNTQATHSTYSGSAAQGRTPYAPSNGVMRGLVGFPSQASRLSGASVRKIEVYVYAKSWHASAGGTACLGVHGHGSKPGNWSATTNDVKRQKMKRPEGRWITLPSSVHNGFKLGNLTGISFYPPGGSTSTEYYGLFTGNKTKLRITYTK